MGKTLDPKGILNTSSWQKGAEKNWDRGGGQGRKVRSLNKIRGGSSQSLKKYGNQRSDYCIPNLSYMRLSFEVASYLRYSRSNAEFVVSKSLGRATWKIKTQITKNDPHRIRNDYLEEGKNVLRRHKKQFQLKFFLNCCPFWRTNVRKLRLKDKLEVT